MFRIETVAVMGATEAGGACALGLAVSAGPLARLAVAAGPATPRHVLDRAAAFAARVNEAAGAP